jgi:hypothetical protein
MKTVGTIERAYQLAPTSASLEEVRNKLRREGYAQVDAHLSGRVIRCDLAKLLGNVAGPGTN